MYARSDPKVPEIELQLQMSCFNLHTYLILINILSLDINSLVYFVCHDAMQCWKPLALMLFISFVVARWIHSTLSYMVPVIVGFNLGNSQKSQRARSGKYLKNTLFFVLYWFSKNKVWVRRYHSEALSLHTIIQDICA